MNSVQCGALALAFLSSVTMPVRSVAAENNVATPECRRAVAAVGMATGAVLDRISDWGVVFLRHPLTKDLDISCMSTDLHPVLSIYSEGPLPPTQWFDLVGKAGSVWIGVDATEVVSKVKSCLDQTLKENHQSVYYLGNYEIDCDGSISDERPAGISIYPRSDNAPTSDQ